MLEIIRKGIENKAANIVMPYKSMFKATLGVLRPVMVTTSPKGYHGNGKDEKESSQYDYWAGAPSL